MCAFPFPSTILGKMVHIFLTGQPGVGKSTLIQKVLTKFKASVRIQGFYTGEVRSGGERIGFDVTTLPESLNGPLSRVGSAKKGDPVVGKYVVDLASFETLGLPTLEPREGVQLYILDGTWEFMLTCTQVSLTCTCMFSLLPHPHPLYPSIYIPLNRNQQRSVRWSSRAPSSSPRLSAY